MPSRIPRACRKRGCAGTTTDSSGYCDKHRGEGWVQHQRGLSRHQRGYGSKWTVIRARILKRDKGLYRHHCETLDVEGYTYRTETQNGDVLIKAHPAAAMKADAWKRIRAMLAEFGMSPASRAKVNIAGPDDVDPLAELLKARD